VSRTIRIDDDVFAALQARATDALRDTPNRVLRKVLDLDGGEPNRTTLLEAAKRACAEYRDACTPMSGMDDQNDVDWCALATGMHDRLRGAIAVTHDHDSRRILALSVMIERLLERLANHYDQDRFASLGVVIDAERLLAEEAR